MPPESATNRNRSALPASSATAGQVGDEEIDDVRPRPVAVIYVDERGHVGDLNQDATSLLGHSPLASGPLPALVDYFHAEDRHRVTAGMARARAAGYVEVRARLAKPGATVLPVVLCMTSLTEPGHLTVALLQGGESDSSSVSGHLGEAFYHTFLEQSPVGIVHLDRCGEVTFENHRLRQLTGEGQEASWLGLHLSEVRGLEERLASLVEEMLTKGTPVRGEHIGFLSPTRDARILAVHGSPIVQPEVGIVGGVLTIADITTDLERELELSSRHRYGSAEPALRNAALAATSEHAFLDEAVKVLGETAGADQVFALLSTEDADAYEEEVRWASAPERSLVPVRIEVASGDELAHAFEEAELSHQRSRRDRAPGGTAEVMEAVGAGAAIAIPFATRGNRAGALLLVRSAESEPWNAVDRAALLQLGVLFETLLGWLRAEARYSQVIDTIEDSLFSFTIGASGHRAYALISGQVEALTGYSAHQLVAPEFVWNEIVHPDDQSALEVHHRALLEGRDATLVYRINHRGGAVRWLRESAFPSRDRVGRILVGGMLSDVTEQKETEASLLLAMQDAEAASKLKSSFLATMSHELRTPLGAIKGFAELLREEVSLLENAAPEIVEFADVIEANANRVLRLVNDLFDLAKLQTDRLPLVQGAVALPPVLEQVTDRYRQRLSLRGVALVLDLDSADQIVQADATRLDQVLEILLSNAAKFTEQGEVRLKTIVEPAEVVVVVEDSGIGMDADYIPQLFEPFTQEDNRLNRSYEGSGLGLALAQRLVTAMQGSIAITSQRGVGTRVEVRLQRANL